MRKNILIAFAFSFLFSCSKKENHKMDSTLYADFDKANLFYEKNAYDSAYFYYNKSVSANRDSLLVGKSLFNMAITQSVQGDYFGSNETAIRSINYFKKSDSSYLATLYNTIAVNKNDLKEYNEAIVWYKKSIAINFNSRDSVMSENNLAVAFYKTKKYDTAKIIYTKLLKNDTVLNNNNLLAKVIDNFAYAKWLEDPNYNAQPEFAKALNIRLKERDFWGQNASYAHLSNYYEKKNTDSALTYAQQMYLIAKKLDSPDDRLEALQKLIKLSQPAATKQYFLTYQTLTDSLYTSRSAAKNQFALVRYETEKNRANFLKAQAENVEKQSDILRKNIGLGVLILLFIFGYFLYRKRQKELRREKELEVKKTELKYIKKVHDRVANKVYQVMSEVENTPEMDKTVLTDKLDVIYKISRDLSYESTDVDTKESFPKELLKMLYAYSSAKIDIAVKGNDAGLWQNVKGTTKNEVYLILQNLMTNMDKHSGADSVSIKFERTSERITVLYTDNGKGMQGAVKKNGLSNTETRIESISGRITFDTKPDKGLEIEFSFPI